MAAKRKKRASGGRRATPLTRARILAAAFELADEVGADGLTMRRLGRALGVEAMALYNHVANKDDLLDGLVDLAFADIDMPPLGDDWKPAMRVRCLALGAMLLRHRWALGLLESRTNPGPANLRHHDDVLGCLRRAGFSRPLAVHAYSLLDSYVYGFILQQHTLPFDDAEELKALASQMLQQIPADEYPYLAEVGQAHVVDSDYDHADEFEWGLDLVLDGLERALAAEGAQSGD